MKRYALLSVSDRTGLAQFAAKLHKAGYSLLATSGTGKELDGAGLPWTSVESYAGLAELLDGRVKTLHPKIHGGILARRDNKSHQAQMKEADIAPIDVVVVNLYPFTDYVKTERAADPEQMVELVDVGGPTMIRAAAKNHRFVLPVIDPADYDLVSELLGTETGGDPFPLALRRRLAAKVFRTLSGYDGTIASYFEGPGSLEDGSQEAMESTDGLPLEATLVFSKLSDLRYGENPHQSAALYRINNSSGAGRAGTLALLSGTQWEQLGGKELSYNNMLDLDSALRLLSDLPKDSTAVAILKHLNPCGVAIGRDVTDAIQRAKQCDPRSHFGGVMVANREIDTLAAEEIREDFAELIIAPSFTEEALSVLRTSKNLRILKATVDTLGGYEVRSVAGAILVQEPDVLRTSPSGAELVSGRVPTDEEIADLGLAWRLVAHVKSNAIVLVKDGLLVGVGAGQMSRIDSIELAIKKALHHGHLLQGAVAASDAFFPFPDSIDALAEAGITCVVSPGGAKRDEDVRNRAKERGVSLFFAASRHFRH
jgi:phosphoribosylaminoimidazolecarboxamide formyltransferase/IMP cyclohydrolase